MKHGENLIELMGYGGSGPIQAPGMPEQRTEPEIVPQEVPIYEIDELLDVVHNIVKDGLTADQKTSYYFIVYDVAMKAIETGKTPDEILEEMYGARNVDPDILTDTPIEAEPETETDTESGSLFDSRLAISPVNPFAAVAIAASQVDYPAQMERLKRVAEITPQLAADIRDSVLAGCKYLLDNTQPVTDPSADAAREVSWSPRPARQGEYERPYGRRNVVIVRGNRQFEVGYRYDSYYDAMCDAAYHKLPNAVRASVQAAAAKGRRLLERDGILTAEGETKKPLSKSRIVRFGAASVLLSAWLAQSVAYSEQHQSETILPAQAPAIQTVPKQPQFNPNKFVWDQELVRHG